MTRVIKATDRSRGVHGVAFNFDDMAGQAHGYLDNVRAEADKILAKARQDAEGIRRQAEAEGRRAGEAAIHKLVDEKIAAQLKTVLPALRTAIHEIQHSRQAWLAHWEQRAVKLAAAMAARVVRRELSKAPEITLKLVREGLQLASGGGHVRVRMNPADRDALGSGVDAVVAEFGRLGPVELVADATITTGGCRIETRFGAIDQQIEAQLSRLEQELT